MSKKMRKSNKEGYSVIVERANPHEIVNAVIPKKDFETLCKVEFCEAVDNSIVKEKESNNGN